MSALRLASPGACWPPSESAASFKHRPGLPVHSWLRWAFFLARPSGLLSVCRASHTGSPRGLVLGLHLRLRLLGLKLKPLLLDRSCQNHVLLGLKLHVQLVAKFCPHLSLGSSKFTISVELWLLQSLQLCTVNTIRAIQHPKFLLGHSQRILIFYPGSTFQIESCSIERYSE